MDAFIRPDSEIRNNMCVVVVVVAGRVGEKTTGGWAGSDLWFPPDSPELQAIAHG